MSDCETTTNVSREILERAEQERIQMAEAESRRFLCADCERLEVDLALNAKMLARQCDLARGAETERDAVQSENERLRQELAMVRETGIEATREIMSELREVAEILGGPGNTKPAVDLAKDVRTVLVNVDTDLVKAIERTHRAESALAEASRSRCAYKANSEESLDAIDLWRLEKAKLESALQNLLAVIHRDGGQHTSDVGLTQSVADAHQAWANLIAQAEEAANLRSALAEAQAALVGADWIIKHQTARLIE